MADEKLVALLKQGSRVWNDRRQAELSNLADPTARLPADLTGANLTDADLADADLNGADLAGARLSTANLGGANLSGANLRDANLIKAILTSARLTYAELTGASLAEAYLLGTNLTGSVLAHAVLTNSKCMDTVLADVDLSQTIGLESLLHLGPSTIDHRTLARSGPLPIGFLRGFGLPDRLIEYLSSLHNAGPIQFYSCFISYSTADQRFAERLHADLQARGVRWRHERSERRVSSRAPLRTEVGRADDGHQCRRPDHAPGGRAWVRRDARDRRQVSSRPGTSSERTRVVGSVPRTAAGTRAVAALRRRAGAADAPGAAAEHARARRVNVQDVRYGACTRG